MRCGAPLDARLEHARNRRAYAAAPAEGRYAPRLISSLFPRLPRGSERHFRIALALGVLAVAVLAVLRLFGVALVTAALLMPLISLLYLYDVDVYETSPGWPVLWTIVWGTAAGIAVGLLARALAPSGPALVDRSSAPQLLGGGLLVPAVGAVAMLAGPLVLLPYRRFNDALDGATFAGVSAAAFAAAQALVVGRRDAGRRPAAGGCAAAVDRAAAGDRGRHAGAGDGRGRLRRRRAVAALPRPGRRPPRARAAGRAGGRGAAGRGPGRRRRPDRDAAARRPVAAGRRGAGRRRAGAAAPGAARGAAAGVRRAAARAADPLRQLRPSRPSRTRSAATAASPWPRFRTPPAARGIRRSGASPGGGWRRVGPARGCGCWPGPR